MLHNFIFSVQGGRVNTPLTSFHQQPIFFFVAVAVVVVVVAAAAALGVTSTSTWGKATAIISCCWCRSIVDWHSNRIEFDLQRVLITIWLWFRLLLWSNEILNPRSRNDRPLLILISMILLDCNGVVTNWRHPSISFSFLFFFYYEYGSVVDEDKWTW